MRKLAMVVLVVVGCAAVGARAVTAKTDGANVRGTCANTNGIDVYFWPQGHGAVPALGFGSYPVPHMEFYKPHDFTNPAFLAFAQGSSFQLASGCSATADRAMTPAATLSPPSTQEQKIRCTFTGGVDVRTAPLNKVTTRYVKKTIFVKVKGKRVRKVVRRPVKTVTRIGSVATAAVAGTNEAVVSVEIKPGSTVRYDTRMCAPVPLAS